MYKKYKHKRRFPRRKRKYVRRYKKYYKKRAMRIVSLASETKRRIYASGDVESLPGDRKLFNPLYWLSQGASDAQVTGNGLYLKAMMLRGRVTCYNGTTPLIYVQPINGCIYLFYCRDQISTGALAESWVSDSASVNNWFVGGNDVTNWFVNNSQAKCLYKKKFQLVNQENQAWSVGGSNDARAPRSYNFFCKKNINRMFYFRELGSGSLNGNFGKYGNYYWVMAFDTPLGYADSALRFNVTSYVAYKDL